MSATAATGGVWATIVTRNRLHLLQPCVESIRNQERKPEKILVIDNGSDDGTAEWLDAQADLMVVHQGNTGSSGGQYTAFKTAYEAGASWVWTMDDDVLCRPDTLAELLKAAEIAGDVGYLSSRVVNEAGTSMNVPGIDMWRAPNTYAAWERFLEHGMAAIEEGTFVSLLVPRQTIARVGYPIEAMFIWGDDTEYTRRCRTAGPAFLVGKSVAVHCRPTAAPIHIWTDDNAQRLPLYRYLYKNQAYIARIHKQHLFRRNQQVVIGPAFYCLLLVLVSLKDALKHRRLAPLRYIFGGTWAGLRVDYTVEVPGPDSR